MNEQRQAEILWRTEKYKVMYHSQNHYNEIRQLMKDHAPLEVIHQTISEAFSIPPTNGSKLNAIQHMWGYFKKFATIEEKESFKILSARREYNQLLRMIYELAKKYNSSYLLESTVFNKIKNK